ncbi:MAG: M2 family metallopeptidase [bacterium]|nr:M2 family metallopeptidase [bacterium]
MKTKTYLPSTSLLLTALLICAPLAAQDKAAPTPEEAAEFIEQAEAALLRSWIERERAGWVQANFITEDTELMAATAAQRTIELSVDLAGKATRFDGLDLSSDLERKLAKLKLALVLPAPRNAEETAELARIAAAMEGAYGRGEHCAEDGECRDIGDLSRVLTSSRDAAEQLEAWRAWRTIAPPIQPDFERYVELGNKGAQELGFADLGSMWRSKYDMDPDDFAAELDRLWGQVRPLYEALHCHVRARLAETYGTDVVDSKGPIPAHLLGNMWAQTWSNVYDLVGPVDSDAGYDLTELLETEGVDEREMVRYGERFFTSLGFEPMPETFWQRSLFVQPTDHDAVCHASAWDIDWRDDLRIKMCIEITAEDFNTIHHELGHNIYQRAYKDLPPLYTDSANDGFHEAVGDTIALSVTPGYLVALGLLDSQPPASADLGLLLRMALDKVAFLPFGLLVDQWRWQVFSGEVTPADYNTAWWRLRNQYQGIAAPVERTAADFDPGAKYHVPANVPYTRYFLAHILQFQFHRSLCDAAGYEGPLNRCSIYRSEEAGKRLQEMLEMGASRPWPDALEALTGQRQMDATAILDYFAPLAAWLDEQNEGRTCGW